MAMPSFERIEGKGKGLVILFHERFLYRKATPISSQDYDAIYGKMAVDAQLSSKTITFNQLLKTNKNYKYPKSVVYKTEYEASAQTNPEVR